MNKDEAIQVIRNNFPTGRNQLCEALETLIPELKKSDDEKIRKTLKSFFDSEISDNGNVEWRNGIRYGEIVSWLEKQGEQSHYNGEVNDEALQQQFQIWFDKGKCSGRDEVILHPENFGLQKQGEQKPADKVEPKFKIGDWIVSNRTNKTYKIDSIDTKDANYIIYSCVPSVYTNEDSPCFSESMIHLWTIQDAKDGDVLAFDSEYKGNRMVQVGIIKKYVGKHGGCSNTFNIYVGVNWDNNLQIGEYMGCSDIRPATKEQRDLLFVKLKEAGYEWDVEKKELKKIEQKPAWSGKDLCCYDDICEILINLINSPKSNVNKDVVQKDLDWLMSIRDRIKPQSKLAWSEEDEDTLDIAIRIIQNGGDDCAGILDSNKVLIWLKSLKERYTWKPSDEQIEALLKLEEMHVLEHEKNQENAHLYMVVKSIKEQLFKLKGK